MKTLRKTIQRIINPRLISVLFAAIALALGVLELLLFPWDTIIGEIGEGILPDSLSFLSIISIILSLVALVLSMVMTIRTEAKLRKEKEILKASINYMRLLSYGSNSSHVEKIFESIIRSESITRKEYADIQKLFNLISDENAEQPSDINTALDNAKDALIKLTEVSRINRS